jgi:putative peptidoglycan lipid II flippase
MRRGTTVVTALLLPAAVGLWLCAESLVITIFRSGAFSIDDAERTICVTQFIAVALLPLGFYKLLIRALNAGRQERKPMRIALVSVVLNTVLNVILVQTPLYEAGLALASLISGSVACLLAAISLQRLGTGALLEFRHLLRPVLCSLLMAAGVAGLLWWWPLASGASVVAHLWRLVASVILGGGLYLVAMGPGNLRRLGR